MKIKLAIIYFSKSNVQFPYSQVKNNPVLKKMNSSYSVTEATSVLWVVSFSYRLVSLSILTTIICIGYKLCKNFNRISIIMCQSSKLKTNWYNHLKESVNGWVSHWIKDQSIELQRIDIFMKAPNKVYQKLIYLTKFIYQNQSAYQWSEAT